jgi:hypothetical protein
MFVLRSWQSLIVSPVKFSFSAVVAAILTTAFAIQVDSTGLPLCRFYNGFFWQEFIPLE